MGYEVVGLNTKYCTIRHTDSKDDVIDRISNIKGSVLVTGRLIEVLLEDGKRIASILFNKTEDRVTSLIMLEDYASELILVDKEGNEKAITLDEFKREYKEEAVSRMYCTFSGKEIILDTDLCCHCEHGYVRTICPGFDEIEHRISFVDSEVLYYDFGKDDKADGIPTKIYLQLEGEPESFDEVAESFKGIVYELVKDN